MKRIQFYFFVFRMTRLSTRVQREEKNSKWISAIRSYGKLLALYDKFEYFGLPCEAKMASKEATLQRMIECHKKRGDLKEVQMLTGKIKTLHSSG
ncbi:MAG: hypothetical protein AMXMBFR84_02780 [Candidatus Hydrogenedentota bacterium]